MLAGSVTLTGGPATGLAFAPLFEQAGVVGASSVAIAVAIGGIVAGGLVGGPMSTVLIERGTSSRRAELEAETSLARPPAPSRTLAERIDRRGRRLADREESGAILVAMWIGYWVSTGFAALGMTLPAYIGAMLVAAVIRNLDDVTGWFGLSHRFINAFGIVTLTLFLVMALMTLKLWELAGLALPLVAILLAQVALVALAAVPVFRSWAATTNRR